jgi:hypothetical protein
MRSRQLDAFELEAVLAMTDISHDRAGAKQLAARARRGGFLLIARRAQQIAAQR